MIRAAILFMLLGLACRHPSPAVEFHTLRPLAAGTGAQVPQGSAVRLQVMAVRLPELLQRSQIVVQTRPGVHHLSSTHRWGNTLEKDMQRVLSENLAVLLGSGAIVFQAEGTPATHRLYLEVLQCDGAPGGTLHLRATWTLVPAHGGRGAVSQRFTYLEPTRETGFEGFVAAHDRAMESLSREIAAAVKALGAPQE